MSTKILPPPLLGDKTKSTCFNFFNSNPALRIGVTQKRCTIQKNGISKANQISGIMEFLLTNLKTPPPPF